MKKILIAFSFLLSSCSNQQVVYMDYYKKYDAYGIKQTTIDNIISQGKIPNIKIRGIKQNKDWPTIGFLITKEPDLYTISASNLNSIIDAGGNIKLLDYTNNIKQMKDVDGLYLPGGYFISPKEYYAHPMPQDHKTDQRAMAYISSIKEAQKNNLPILGICAGAQMIGGIYGIKMQNNINNHHKPAEVLVHNTEILKNTPLDAMFAKSTIKTNSMHNEAMLIETIKNTNLKTYALAQDGILEAFGNEDDKVLGIQWHPETMYYKLKDQDSLKVFEWLTNQAREAK